MWLQENEARRISRQLAQEGGKVVSPMHWPAFTSRQHPWYSFLFEAESTKGRGADRRTQTKKNPNDPTGNQTCDLPA
jgi:hypothetical protein